nr:HNH endonuclease [Cellulomonas uda]
MCVVPVRRAVLLLLLEKAVVERPGATVLHSERLSVVAPSVVRLQRYVRVPHRSHVPITRRAVLARDHERWPYCAGRADTVDHVVPRSRSGPHAWENVVAACARCNHRKADRLLSELGWELPFTPRAPRGPLAGHTVHVRQPDWEPYLLGWADASVA